MVAGRHNFVVEQGATFARTIIVSAGGQPLNMTNYTARMQARRRVNTPPVIYLSTQNGGIAIDGPNGRLTLSLSATATAALDFGATQYDLEIESDTGVVTRLLSGLITLSREITK